MSDAPSQFLRIGRVWLAGLLAAVVVGCGGPAATPTATDQALAHTAQPGRPLLAEPIPEDIAEAMHFRETMGLRADRAYVEIVARDPRATTGYVHVPLLPEEEQELKRRQRMADSILADVQAYTTAHADEFAGLYLDQQHGGILVTRWTANAEVHDAALRLIVGARGAVVGTEALFSYRELRRLQDVVAADADWFATIPARLQGVGVDEIRNVLRVDISSANPDAEAIIRHHFGLGTQLEVMSDGTGAALLPVGWVRGRTVMAHGGPPGDDAARLNVTYRTDVPGWCGGGDIGFGVTPDGSFEIPCKAGRRTIVIEVSMPDEWVVVGAVEVDVPADRAIETVIVLDPLPAQDPDPSSTPDPRVGPR
ncbi:MAG TPA: hypothetical protein VFR14_03185 [Candidatus Limnocylindrales bacterium]|nr:hypothetical protein [Candidatus Limnocylindrales bacterium]